MNVRYDGDLTVILSFGLEIRIPNHQLVLPDYQMSPQGELKINGSDRVVRISSAQNSDKEHYMPTFGQLFLSSAYILVNDDMKQFTLWKSNPTTARNLLAVGENCESVTSSSRLPTRTSALISPFASTPTDPELQNPKYTKPNRRFGTGSITGIIVGGIAGIFLFCGAILMIRRQRNIKNGRSEGDESRQNQEFNHGILYNKSELPADRQPPQEMPADRPSLQEMSVDSHPPQEMPVDRRPQEMPPQWLNICHVACCFLSYPLSNIKGVNWQKGLVEWPLKNQTHAMNMEKLTEVIWKGKMKRVWFFK